MIESTIDINGHVFTVEISDTPAEWAAGLSDYPSLPVGDGMLFIFDQESQHPMVMRDMEFDLDIIHIDSTWAVNSVESITKDDDRSVVGTSSSKFVLEINAGMAQELGIQPGVLVKPAAELAKFVEELHGTPIAKAGAKVETAKDGTKLYKVSEDDIEAKGDKLQLLDTNGEVNGNIDEGARIFSREHTEELVSMANSAENEKDLEALGLRLVGYIHKQDTQEPEYTT